MTESDWLACGDPQMMLEFLRGRASDRRLLLFLLYRLGQCRCMLPSLEAVSLSVAAPVQLSSKDLLGGSSWDGSV